MNGVLAYDENLSKKDQYSQPFSHTRDSGNEIATFHPGQNAPLKNLSTEKPSKTTKIFNKAGHYYNSFFLFCPAFEKRFET